MTGPRPRKYIPDLSDFDIPGVTAPVEDTTGAPKPKRKYIPGFEDFNLGAPAATDASQVTFQKIDRSTGLPLGLRTGLMGAGSDADKVAYLKSRGYQATVDPKEGLLWFNEEKGKWATPEKREGINGPKLLSGAGDLVAMAGGATAVGGPLNPLGAVAAAGLTLAAKRALEKKLMQATGPGTVPDTRSPGAIAAETAGDVAEGATGEATGQLLGAASKARPVRRLVQRLFQPVTPAAEAAARMDLPVTIGNFSERGPAKSLATFLQSSPAGGPLQEGRQELLDAVTQKADEIGHGILPRAVTKDEAAGTIQHIGTKGYDAFRARIGEMDDQVGSAITAKFGRVPEVANVEGLFHKLDQAARRAPNTDGPAYRPILERLAAVIQDTYGKRQHQGVPFETLRALRSSLNDLANPAAGERVTVPKYLIRQAEEAVDADLGQAALRVDPTTAQLWADRNAFIRENRDAQRPLSWLKFQRAVKTGQDLGALRYAEQINHFSPGRVRQLRQLADQQAPGSWSIIAREQWDRLGRDGPGAEFDPVRFLTNLRRMPEAVQREYFDNASTGDAFRALQDLMPVLHRLEQEGIRPPNAMGKVSASQTRPFLYPLIGGLSAVGAGLGGATAGPAGAGAGAVAGPALGFAAGNAMSRLLAWPAFGRWLKTTAEMQVHPGTQAGWRMIGRLVGMAKARGKEDDVRAYLESIGVEMPE